MLRWIPYAMVRVAVFFTAGILLAIYFPEIISLHYAVSFSITFLVVYLIVRFGYTGSSIGFLAGVIGLLCLFFLGYSHLILKSGKRNDQTLAQLNDTIQFYTAIVRSSPESKTKSWKVEVEVESVKASRWQPTTGRVLLYVSKKVGTIDWRYGDRLMIKGSPILLKSPANPGEFDFKRFLSFKNIYHQQFVLPDQIKLLSRADYKGFVYYSHLARKWALAKTNQYILGDQQRAIAAALVLGVTEGINTDLQNAYSASGAMHVLAVSGLHVGIIYAILLLLLKPLNRYAWSRWVVAIISLICLWVFAFVTGLSPSVMRAVVMFSFVAIARPFGQRTNIYNTLAASAFVLLLYNPYLVMSVGFQLSYLAVLGIVYLQRPIYNLWEVENWLGDWVWQITCVSIAAQIATFSLGLLYFHQFPVYFLISNLFVIPLSTAVLVGGILLLAVSFFSPLAGVIGKLLTGLIYGLNWTVIRTEELPFSLISNVHITTLQCWLLMAVLGSIMFLVEFRSIRWLYVASLLTVLFTYFQWRHFGSSVNKKQFVVYSISGHPAMEFSANGQSYFIADSALMGDEERIRFHIRPNRQLRGVESVIAKEGIPFINRRHGFDLLEWEGRLIGINKSRKSTLPTNLNVDYLVVSHNSFSIDKELDEKRIGTLIADGSNSRGYLKKLAKFAEERKIPFHSVLDKGAFVLTD